MNRSGSFCSSPSRRPWSLCFDGRRRTRRIKVAEGVLTNTAGMTLYTFDNLSEAARTYQRPLHHWPPVMAAADAKPEGDYGFVARDDGAKHGHTRASRFTSGSRTRRPATRPATGSTRSGASPSPDVRAIAASGPGWRPPRGRWGRWAAQCDADDDPRRRSRRRAAAPELVAAIPRLRGTRAAHR